MSDRSYSAEAGQFASRSYPVPRIRPVMQMLLRTGAASEDGRRFAMKAVVDWAAEKWPALVPRAAWNGEEFEHDEPGLEIGAVNLPERALWGFRVEHPDSGVPGRAWLLEAIVASMEEGFNLVGVRSQCTAGAGGEVPATSPRFLRAWLDRLDIIDADRPVSTRPHDVAEEASLQELIALLRDARRQLPVIVVSEFPNGTCVFEPSTPEALAALARRTAGLAHVVRLRAAQADELSQALGRELAVFNGAVRTYRPGFGQPDDTQPHVNALPGRIIGWPGAEGNGIGAFVEYLVTQSHRFSVGTPGRLDQMPSFVQLRRFKAERERAAQAERIAALQKDVESRAGTDANAELKVVRAELEEKRLLLQVAELEAQEANKKAADAEALFDEQESERKAAQEERDALRATNADLLAGIRRLKEARGETARQPAAYAEIADWVDQSLSDRLVLLSRARRSLKDAVFQDTSLVVRCLLLLANEYWILRTADPEEFASAKLAFDTRMQELGVDEAPSISAASLGKLEEHYTVNYTIGYTSKQTLDRHLRGGANTKDDHFCMRIYFFWDPDQQKVVVGHLPSHLDTRAT